MRLRGTPTYGGATYYRLIASVHAGEPVRADDTSLRGPHGRRDALLKRYATPELQILAVDEMTPHAERQP